MRISTNKKREALANGITQHQSKEKVKDKKVEKRAKSDAKKRISYLGFSTFPMANTYNHPNGFRCCK